MIESDEVLMLAVRSGDLDKLGALFNRYSRTLFEFFIRMDRDRAKAEDLVQEVFVRVLKYRKTYRDEGSFRTWIFHIARNARIDSFRSNRTNLNAPVELSGLAAPGQLQGDRVERQEQHEMLSKALQLLSDKNRELLVLARYQDMKYADIAQLLGCEVGSVKVQVHRAMKELRGLYLQLSKENQHAL
jgi:RNA polymerase sigma factor (sigma-70 family)